MTEKRYTSIAAGIFLLIAIGHLLRVAFGLSFVVSDIAVPMWASLVAVAVLGILSAEGFLVSHKCSKHGAGK